MPAKASTIDHRVFTAYPKVRMQYDGHARARIAEVGVPCMVVQLIDWLYAGRFRRLPPHRSEAGDRVLDKNFYLRAFVDGRELEPWNYVPIGAYVVFKRLPFTDDLYRVTPWHASTRWEQRHLQDHHLIHSFTAHQDHSQMMERDFMRQTMATRKAIAEEMGQKVAKPHKRVFGVMGSSLRRAETPQELEHAMLDASGKLVVACPDLAQFQQLVAPCRARATNYPRLTAPGHDLPLPSINHTTS